jgi:2-amino-4-hydroxy-6-hydroxymethyldihydropteridine diphosphokinase
LTSHHKILIPELHPQALFLTKEAPVILNSLKFGQALHTKHFISCRMAHNIYLLLGSNLGDREQIMIDAVEQIAHQIGDVLKESSVYETAPWGLMDQPSFLNKVIEVSTNLSPTQVLETILSIEEALGRVRDQRWGARLIDIDLLYYGHLVLDAEHLTIPHPRLSERRFTLVPLCEIAADFEHPVFRRSNQALLALCKDEGEVLRYKSSG